MFHCRSPPRGLSGGFSGRQTGTAPVRRRSRKASHRYRTSAPKLNNVSANGLTARAAWPLALGLDLGLRGLCNAFRLRRGTGAAPVPRTAFP